MGFCLYYISFTFGFRTSQHHDRVHLRRRKSVPPKIPRPSPYSCGSSTALAMLIYWPKPVALRQQCTNRKWLWSYMNPVHAVAMKVFRFRQKFLKCSQSLPKVQATGQKTKFPDANSMSWDVDSTWFVPPKVGERKIFLSLVLIERHLWIEFGIQEQEGIRHAEHRRRLGCWILGRLASSFLSCLVHDEAMQCLLEQK